MVEELADLSEVMLALMGWHGIEWQDVVDEARVVFTRLRRSTQVDGFS